MNNEKKGVFISFEGGEGTGKTTQIALLADSLQKKGYEVAVTREPGGTPEAEKIRDLLVQREGGDWTPMAESLLLFAARNMHVKDLIAPALAEGKVVICDRFTDSTRAYQSYGRGLDRNIVEGLNNLSLNGFSPSLTFILDMPVEQGLMRAEKRLADNLSQEDRFERMDVEFHERLRRGYLEIAEQEPGRCHVINAGRSVAEIAEDLERVTLEKLNV